MDFTSIIEDYIAKRVKGKDEKAQVRNLLLVDLKQYMEELQLPYSISLESLQAREGYRQAIADAFWDL